MFYCFHLCFSNYILPLEVILLRTRPPHHRTAMCPLRHLVLCPSQSQWHARVMVVQSYAQTPAHRRQNSCASCATTSRSPGLCCPADTPAYVQCAFVSIPVTASSSNKLHSPFFRSQPSWRDVQCAGHPSPATFASALKSICRPTLSSRARTRLKAMALIGWMHSTIA